MSRALTPIVLVSLMAIVTPPEAANIEYRDGFLRVAGRAQFDLGKLTELINNYSNMPGIPAPQETKQ
jgi:hypothetical protein